MTSEYSKRIDDDGTITEAYYKDGRLHREDGPAYIQLKADGSTLAKYYKDGQLYRPEIPRPVIVEYQKSIDSITETFSRSGEVYLIMETFGPNSPMSTRGRAKPQEPRP